MGIITPYRLNRIMGGAPAGEANTLTLLHANTTGLQTLDNTGNDGTTWALGGSGVTSGVQKKWGVGSIRFGSGGTLTAATWNKAADWDNWTVEWWLYPTNTYYGFTSASEIRFRNGTNNRLRLIFALGQLYMLAYDSGGGQVLAMTSTNPGLSYNTHNHIAFTRSGTSWCGFANGNRLFDEATDAGTMDSFTNVIYTASATVDIHYFDDVRISDTVRYSGATYTVPSAEFADAA